MPTDAGNARWLDAWKIYAQPRVRTMLFLGFSAGLPFLLVMVYIIYYCYGTQLSVNASSAADFWGPKNVGANYGILFTAWGVAGVIGPILGGRMYDLYQNYQAAFYTAGVICVVALVSELLAKRPVPPVAVKAPA